MPPQRLHSLFRTQQIYPHIILLSVDTVMMKKRSIIGHAGLPFNCPHDDEFVAALLASLRIQGGARVLDIGCGRGELLRRAVASAPGAVGIGVDNSADMLSAWPDCNDIDLTPVNSDLEEYIDTFLSNNYVEECFDAIFCIGALPAGKQRDIIGKIRRMLKPGGKIIVGELVWVSGPPSGEFIDYVGVASSDYCSLEELKAALRGESTPPECEIISTHTVSVEKYETHLLDNVQEWASLNSDDGDAEKILSVSLAWNDFGRRVAWKTWEFATVVSSR